MENRIAAYIPPEARSLDLRRVPTHQEIEEHGMINFSARRERKLSVPHATAQLFPTPTQREEQDLVDFAVQKDQHGIQDDLSRVEELQRQWEMVLGVQRNDETNLIHSYNPVLARWKYEQCQTDEERKKFVIYETVQQITNLHERNHASTSRYHYLIDQDGRMRNEYFADEPFEESIKRGMEWRKRNGSKELDREAAELEGFYKIQQLIDAPIGTTAISLSGPGVVKEKGYKTGYPDNYVDVFKVVLDDKGDKLIETTRYKSAMSYDQYRQIAEQLHPGYFDGESGPIDAWLLSHPIIKASGELPESADEIFEVLFEKPKDALREDEMHEIVVACMPYIQYLLSVLTQPVFDPEKIALAFNTVLIKGDKAHTDVMRKREGKGVLKTHDTFYMSIDREVEVVGRQRVEVRDAGCGDSAGFSLGLENSVARFGLNTLGKAEDDPNLCKCKGLAPHFHCPGTIKVHGTDKTEPCKNEIIVGKGTTQCPKCGEGKKC